MTVMVEPPNSVVLIVGREQFTLPASFGGATSVATKDCIALAVRADGATSITFAALAPTDAAMTPVGEHDLESEGLLSVRDVYSRELLTAGVDPGQCTIAIWVDDASEPGTVVLVVHS